MLWQPKQRLAAVDGDLFVHAASNKFNKDDTNEGALKYIERELLFVRDTLDLDDWTIFLTAGGNFRKEIDPNYKLHRAKRERPKYLLDCYRYLYEQWEAISERGYEADDLLGIACTEEPDRVLVSYDKDLKQVAGWHYDTRNFTLSFVTPTSAYRYLAYQLLAGDAADNIKGIVGIGPKKAEKVLDENSDLDPVVAAYQAYLAHGLTFDDFARNYKLLKILTTHEMKWPELDDLARCHAMLDALCVPSSLPSEEYYPRPVSDHCSDIVPD